MKTQKKTTSVSCFLKTEVFLQIKVCAKPRSKKESVEKISETEYVVRVNVPPVDGKANSRIIEALAKYFQTAKSNIKLIKGEKAALKVFEID